LNNVGFSGLPMVDIRQAGTLPRFFAPRDGLGFSLIDLGLFRIGPVGKLLWQRKASSYPELNGLGDIGFTLQVGGFAELWPVQWLRLRAEVRQGFGGETGITGDLFADMVVPIGPLTLSGGPRVLVLSIAT
jgi:MipA family protein